MSSEHNHATAKRLANNYALDFEATKQLEAQVFTELQIAETRGGIVAGLALRDTVLDCTEGLRALLCDPDGNVCIDGSDEDRSIIQTKLDTLHDSVCQSTKAQQEGYGTITLTADEGRRLREFKEAADGLVFGNSIARHRYDKARNAIADIKLGE